MPNTDAAKAAKIKSAKAKLAKFKKQKLNGVPNGDDAISVASGVSETDSRNDSKNEEVGKNQAVFLQYQQQVQLQMQSIHHLVAEKEELTKRIQGLESEKRSQGNDSSSVSLRSKYDSLAKEFALTKEAKLKFQTTSDQLEKELDTLNESYKRVLSRNEDLYERNSELSHQLNIKSADLAANKKELQFLQSQKSQLQTKLSTSNSLNESSSLQEIEQHKEEKHQLLEQMKEVNASLELYKKTVTDLTKERQTLLQQINAINHAWQQKFEKSLQERDVAIQEKNDGLKNKETEEEIRRLNAALDEKSEELRKQLENLKELQASQEALSKSKYDLSKRLDAQVTDNETLVKLNMDQSDKITELHANLVDLQDQVQDRRELLNSAENERSTLNRALQQNKQLKGQFAELQTALIQTNNQRAEALTELETLKHQVNSNQLSSNSNMQPSNSPEFQQVQQENAQLAQILADERLRNAQLQESCDNLSSQVKLYQQTLHEQELRPASAMSIPSSSIPSRSATPRQSTDHSNNNILQALAQERLKTASLNDQVLNLQSIINQTNQITSVEESKLDQTNELVEQLKQRLINETEHRENLHSKIDDLEHANGQLQAENDTIAEYITLYREQRAALKQMQYKDSQKQTAQDEEKEDLKQKLEYLELLVKQLLADRTMVTQKSPDLNDQEIETAEKIFDIIDDVVETQEVPVEPLQLNIPYYGPQWDI